MYEGPELEGVGKHRDPGGAGEGAQSGFRALMVGRTCKHFHSVPARGSPPSQVSVPLTLPSQNHCTLHPLPPPALLPAVVPISGQGFIQLSSR